MEKKGRIAVLFIAILLIGCPNILFAYDQVVEKKVFELKEYVTIAGQKIAPVRVGYETYGKLTQEKDNVILICHHFGGTSHAAGKYSAEDKMPGYWDALIGPGKPFDTDKYFIISSDTIINPNVKNPKVITTGPASINPATGKPYGMSFPLVTIRDFVRIEYALVKSMGIKKLKCVTGASMGGFQSLEWAVTYPDVVERVIPVVSSPRIHAWTLAWLKLWAEAVMLDPKWNKGDYYGKEEPIDGVTYSYKIILTIARSPWWADRSFDRKWADPEKNPYTAMENKFLVEDALDKLAAAGAKVTDANSLIYLAKANELHDIGFGYGSYDEALKRIKAKVLMIPSGTDILIYPYNSRQFVEALNKTGGNASLFEIPSWEGHLGGLSADILKATIEIKAFLAR
jgi:homoserine O-acetyltransferase/O-succinyltransferase